MRKLTLEDEVSNYREVSFLVPILEIGPVTGSRGLGAQDRICASHSQPDSRDRVERAGGGFNIPCSPSRLAN